MLAVGDQLTKGTMAVMDQVALDWGGLSFVVLFRLIAFAGLCNSQMCFSFTSRRVFRNFRWQMGK